MPNSLVLPLVLQLAGIVIIIAEVIVPSGGLLAVLAAGLLGYSLYLVFSDISMATGMYFLTADIILVPIMVLVGLKLLAKSPAALKKELTRQDGVVSQSPELETYSGMQGEALTDLRPSGAASISGKRLDVVSSGDYIPKGSDIVVSRVTGNQIVVDLKEDTE